MDDSSTKLEYLSGFGSHHSSESLPNSLPAGQNSPQVCPYGLYAEQLSGSAFTAPRDKNLRSWLYRIRPSVMHTPFQAYPSQIPQSMDDFISEPNQLRWDPPAIPTSEIDFVDGMNAVCGAGDCSVKAGLCIYNYALNKPMLTDRNPKVGRCMSNADGDYLIVPQLGGLFITTELGNLQVESCEIVCIPRGIKFSVDPIAPDSIARGYVLEVYGGHFELPGLGPIGANGLANPRDFLMPKASYKDIDGDGVRFTLVHKFNSRTFVSTMDHSPYDVVAWHGNYYPFKYDLRKFNTMNTVSFDHPDPSIYTVLTVPSDSPGTAVADFVIFPPRWMVADHTFRPPYYHRNCMSEYMGMIHGQYDAKAGGFVAGGASLHAIGTPHGPDETTFTKASNAKLGPVYFGEGLAFMFESMFVLKVSPLAMQTPTLQKDYAKCWQSLKKNFTGALNPEL